MKSSFIAVMLLGVVCHITSFSSQAALAPSTSESNEPVANSIVYDYGDLGEFLSDKYIVTVDGVSSTVLKTFPRDAGLCGNYPRCDGAKVYRENNRTMSWTGFSFKQSVEVVVTKTDATSGSVSDIKVLPSHNEGVDYLVVSKDLKKREIKLRLFKPNLKLSVEYVDERYMPYRQIPFDSLMLFADQPESKDLAKVPAKPDQNTYFVSADKPFNAKFAAKVATVAFQPGTHDLGYWRVPESVKHVYIAGGAYVRGAIDAGIKGTKYKNGFTLSGRGVLSGDPFPWRANADKDGLVACETMVNGERQSADCWANSVKLVRIKSNDYLVEGVTIVNAPHYSLITKAVNPKRSQGRIDNVKLFGNWLYNNDGFGPNDNDVINDCFVSAYDDAFKVYHHNMVIENCTVWQMDNGAVFQFGWFPKNVTHAVIRNIDVIHAETTGLNQNASILNYAQRTEKLRKHETQAPKSDIKNIRVEGLRVYGPVTRFFGFENYQPRHTAQSFTNWLVKDVELDALVQPEEYGTRKHPGKIFSEGSGNGTIVGPNRRPFNAIIDQADRGRIQGFVIENMTIGGQKLTADNAATLGLMDIQTKAEGDVVFK
ncbi:hypothetical protein [Echinimonas agarilytica]|uniref:Glycoside hydrolase family 49 N-terminal domain-containing protein n=1 Tax=Echinimonas agarilytica TaxID=1215918 RepID=A0AA41W5H2_9GAMM|nr:hypothetical protein [Echinimonas agarilytica]MCM2678995.1 hypothetical protein [Echinimonas agarilytica]